MKKQGDAPVGGVATTGLRGRPARVPEVHQPDARRPPSTAAPAVRGAACRAAPYFHDPV